MPPDTWRESLRRNREARLAGDDFLSSSSETDPSRSALYLREREKNAIVQYQSSAMKAASNILH